jgi:CheY-like chemotaxis protein
VNKPAILVVDDDAQVLAAVRRDLRSKYTQKFTIVSAASGEEALATIRELKTRGDELALVISDQRMPGLQGTDLLAQSRETYPKARRVLLTAYSDIDAAIKAINVAHLDHYVSKPWSPPEEKLFPVVDDLLDTWEAEYLPEAKGLRLIGYQWSPRTHEIKNFLVGNGIPYRWLDVERNPDARPLVDAAGIDSGEFPALLFEDGSPLVNPDLRQVAERLGRPLSAERDFYDLVIAGAGPAGLAAAVYGASEGLRTLVLDRHAPGGQAGNSSKIENYLGFPKGLSGADLARRAEMQAQRLGAELLVPLEVTGVSIDDGSKQITLSDGRTIATRTLLAATGMEYRGIPCWRRRVLRRRDDGGFRVHQPARAHRRRRQFRGPGSPPPGAVRRRRADRGATRLAARHDVAVPDQADRRDEENPIAPADGPRKRRREQTRRTRRAAAGFGRAGGAADGRGVRVHRHETAKRVAAGRRAPRPQWVRDHRPRPRSRPPLRANLEGTPRADAARNERAGGLRGWRHPRRRHQPRRLGRRRRRHGRPVHSRISRLDLEIKEDKRQSLPRTRRTCRTRRTDKR